MLDEEAVRDLAAVVLDGADGPTFVLDAGALARLAEITQPLRRQGGRVVITPHAGEMATLLGVPRTAVRADLLGSAREAASLLQAVVALKGATTYIVSPQGEAWFFDEGNVGLATSGSGDTLAGIICGLAARGASLEQAAVWGVALHARAGDALASRVGPLGYLASELLREVPAVAHELGCHYPKPGGDR
jgi:ADP-dependent NAD(P)H-hydrate dehydratase